MLHYLHVKKGVVWAVVACICTASVFFLSCTKGKTPGIRTAADTVKLCRALAAEAHNDMMNEQAQAALLKLDRCIRTYTADTESNDSLAPIVANALVMMNNTYQGIAQPDGCIARLKQYAQHPTPILAGQCRRDLAIVTAYALSRTEKTDEAALLMDKALAMQPHDESHSRLFRDYAYASAVYFCIPKRQKDVLRCAQTALSEARLCRNTSGAQWVMSLVGILYKRNGDLGSAVDMYNSSFDEAIAQNDTLGIANACNNLADLLLYWHLSDEANRYASRAISIIKDSHISYENPMVTGSILVNKAKICMDINMPDSALYFLNKAQPYCKDLPYNSGQSDIDLARGSIYTATKDIHMQRQGIGMLDKAAQRGTNGIRSHAYLALAKVHAQLGDDKDVTRALDSLYAITQRNDFVIEGASEFALNYALSTNNIDMLKRYAKAVSSDKRINRRHESIRKTSACIVKFDTDRKERGMELKMSELNRKATIYLSILLMSLVMLVAGFIVMFFKRRTYRMQQRLMEEKLQAVSNDLEQALHNETLMKNQLEEMSQQKETDNTNRPEETDDQSENTDNNTDTDCQQPTENVDIDIDRVRDNDGEARFRSLFEKAYPHFLSRLKDLQPNISRKEELLCMLIILGKNSAQIENILCIARSSVNMARYRLRQKLQLTRNDNLDQFLKSLI